MNQKVEPLSSSTCSLWWGEATDEPAREDARPTDRFMAPMRVQSWRLKLSMNRPNVPPGLGVRQSSAAFASTSHS